MSKSLREWPYEWRVGWRYTRAGRATRSNGFISFISGVSMLGIALGVAALIVVLSVMNGFQKEVQSRMLSAVAHVEVLQDRGQALPQLPLLEAAALSPIDVVAAAPFVREQAMLARGEDMRGVQVRGVDPTREPGVTALAAELLPRLTPGSAGVLIGTALAETLGVEEGDALSLLVPRRPGTAGSSGAMGAPRIRPLTVVGIFDSGHYEYDSSLVLVNLEDAQQLFQLDGPNGLRLRLADPDRAPEDHPALALGIVGGDRGVGDRAEPGGDAVDRGTRAGRRQQRGVAVGDPPARVTLSDVGGGHLADLFVEATEDEGSPGACG